MAESFRFVFSAEMARLTMDRFCRFAAQLGTGLVEDVSKEERTRLKEKAKADNKSEETPTYLEVGLASSCSTF